MNKSRYLQNATCNHCGKSFHAARVTAKFCSYGCRVKAHRQAEKQTRLDLDKKKVEHMVTLLKIKIERYEGDIETMKQNSQLTKDEDTRRIYGDMIREKQSTLSELKALWECLE